MADPRVVEALRGRERHEHPDLAIARLAERQHGVVDRRQLIQRGLTPKEIRGRTELGRLYCLHRGVYAVGRPRVSREGRWLAAVLSAGPDAVVSHSTAGALWRICAWRGPIDITVPSSRRPRRGLRWHVARLPADEVTTHDGIPTTSPARTLFDLATFLTLPRLRNALNESEKRRHGSELSLPDLLHRYPRRPGTPNLRKVLADHSFGNGTGESELELEFLDFLDARGFPRPDVNRWIEVGGEMVRPDCLWRDRRLVVELDSWEHHGTREAFEADRARARKLAGAGFRVMQVTSRDVNHGADALAADLRCVL
jgi:very-short-patch-repair endonuclease